ncbi:MAG: hypothetical protein IJ496_02575 [Ruminococcus sp.]|nr:hypothetical protein [Ruminococcus sp.]
MNALKKIKAGLFAAVIGITGCAASISGAGISASSADAVVYDQQDLPALEGRTMQEVADQYSAALYAGETYNNADPSTWYAVPASTSSPYAAGEITADTHKSMVAMTNFFRWLMGNNALTQESVHSDALQAGALVRNFQFDHSVNPTSKPADMSDALWESGAGCSHNILAMGYSPQIAVMGWMNEGYSLIDETWTTIGHRAIMMEMELSSLQYGYSGDVAIGDAAERLNRRTQPFAAFPAPGYMPSELVNSRTCAWSVDLNTDNIELYDEYDVTVTITNRETGAQWIRTADDESLRSSYGCVVFIQPDDHVEGRYSGTYDIVITGLVDTETSSDAEIRYSVSFFNVEDYAAARVRKVLTFREYAIAPDMMNEESLTKVASILPEEVIVETDNGQNLTVSVTGPWQVDMANSCFVNSADVSDLPSRISDPEHIMSRVTIPFFEKTDYTALYDTIDILPNVVEAGESVTMTMYRTNINTDRVQVYKIRENADGSYSSSTRFDSFEVYPEGITDVWIDFTIEQAAAMDSGEYISAYQNQSWIDGFYTSTIFVGNSIPTLTVNGGASGGDIDGDGTIGLDDLVIMTKIIMGDSPMNEVADCNGDGRVNVFDMSFLKELVQC